MLLGRARPLPSESAEAGLREAQALDPPRAIKKGKGIGHAIDAVHVIEVIDAALLGSAQMIEASVKGAMPVTTLRKVC